MTKRATVQCYAGAGYPERPRSFFWEGQQWSVKVVERQWRTPEHLFFCVRVESGQRFELVYDLAADSWEIRALDVPAGGKLIRRAAGK